MKILHIITSLHIGGAEKLMVDLLPMFKKKGLNVELLLFDGTRTAFYNKLIDQGLIIHSLNERGQIYSPLNIIKLKNYISRFDIIHTHNTACQLFVPLAKHIYAGNARLVTTEHNTTNRRRKIFFWKPIDYWMYKQYIKIIAISDKTSEFLRSYIHLNNIVTIYNGIDVSKFSAAQPVVRNNLVPEYTDDDIIITMVAAFRKQKNHLCVLRAAQILPKHFKFCFVGDGELRTKISSQIKRLNLQDRVSILGNGNDVDSIMAASDIIVLSSHWEGFGLVAVEGMAVGKPVIASNVDGLKQVVDGYGLLFEDGDYKELASKIKDLAIDYTFYNQISTLCSKRAQYFDITNMANRYMAVYHEVDKE